MSIFAYPTKLMPDVKTMEEMGNEMMAMVPRQMLPAANLMAYPVGAATAMSVLGMAAMGQAFGLAFGALSGAMDAARRASPDGAFADPAPFEWPSPFAAWQDHGTRGGEAGPETMKAPVSSTPAAVVAEEKAAPVAETPAAPLMPEDFHKPAAIDKPAAPDDLKMISGIGPKLEQVLNARGIWTFAQIAAWTDREIAWVDDTLALRGRIGRDDWLGQAAALASGGREEYVKVFGKEPK